jgi:hypothetical protein
MPFEGMVPFMYLDIKGLVTIGMGNLIDPFTQAKALPFRYRNKPGIKNPGRLASAADIEDEWKRIKGDQTLALRRWKACDPLTTLELNSDAINDLIKSRLQNNELILKRQNVFRDYDKWPADAQLGLLSMAWALGPNFVQAHAWWPQFTQGCQKQAFAVAAQYCHINESNNPGVHPRNVANVQLFKNANLVVAEASNGGYQRWTLYYPRTLISLKGVDYDPKSGPRYA